MSSTLRSNLIKKSSIKNKETKQVENITLYYYLNVGFPLIQNLEREYFSYVTGITPLFTADMATAWRKVKVKMI